MTARKQSRADRLGAIVAAMRAAHGDLEALRDEVQEGFDAMPENLQGSELGEARETAASALDEAADAIGGALDDLEAVEFR